MRHKEFHLLKVHPALIFAVNFAIAQVSTKMKKRVFCYKKVEDVTRVIENKILPAEYGGVMPMSEMIELFRKELESKNDLLIRHDQMSVDAELYPQSLRDGSVRSLRKSVEESINTLDASETSYGVQGSFRQLEFD